MCAPLGCLFLRDPTRACRRVSRARRFTHSVLCALARSDTARLSRARARAKTNRKGLALLGTLSERKHVGDPGGGYPHTGGRLLLLRDTREQVAASNKLGEFASLDYSFNGTREYMLCEQLCAACDAGQGQAVADAAAEYDKIKRMDTWMVKVLLAIKATVDSDEPSVDDAPDEHEVVHAPPAPAEPDLPPDDDDEDDLPDFT